MARTLPPKRSNHRDLRPRPCPSLSVRSARRRVLARSANAAAEALERRQLLSVSQPTMHLDAGSDSGVAGDFITNASTPTLNGTGTVGNTVNVYDGSTMLGNATVAADGTWTFTVGADLTDGTH